MNVIIVSCQAGNVAYSLVDEDSDSYLSKVERDKIRSQRQPHLNVSRWPLSYPTRWGAVEHEQTQALEEAPILQFRYQTFLFRSYHFEVWILFLLPLALSKNVYFFAHENYFRGFLVSPWQSSVALSIIPLVSQNDGIFCTSMLKLNCIAGKACCYSTIILRVH